MYSEAVIAARQETLEHVLGSVLPQGKLTRIPVTHCHAMRQRLDQIWDPEKGQQLRPFSQDEQIFVLNEQLLTKIDYAYAAERYVYINYEGQALKPMYPLWESQRLMMRELGRQEEIRWRSGHPDGLLFNLLKGRQLGACLHPDTRVLTADLCWVPVGGVEEGDFLIAVDEFPPGGRGAGRRMQTAIVEASRVVQEPAYELVFDTGQRITATAPHRFLSRKRSQTETVWRTVDRLRVGDVIRYVTQPWGAADYEDGWMGGMLDGEGSGGAKGAGGAEFCLSQVYGPVYDRMTQYFEARGYTSFHEDPPDLRVPTTSSKFGWKPVGKISIARMDEIFRLIGQARPTRHLVKEWWVGKELPGKRSGFGWAEVVEIVSHKVQSMIDLQTSTKTFIAEGLVSHNSTWVQSLLGHRVLTHSQVRTLIASDVPQNSGSEGIFGMLELLVEKWPWWLKPKERFHTKDRHIMWANGSRVIVESGKSMKGGLQDSGQEKGQIGRSKTYSAVHLTEISSWERPEQINSSLLPAVPRTPRTLLGRESTSLGRNNYWHIEWKLAEAGKDPRFFNIFIPWYAEQSKYWLPYPTNWVPSDDTLKFAARAAEHGPRYMHRPVNLSKEQLYWYELEKAAAMAREELYKFLSEYPSEPEESFQNSGRSIFTVATMDRLASQARPLKDLWTVRPKAELLADREASIQEYQQTLQETAKVAEQQRTQRAGQVLTDNTPQTVREEIPMTFEIENAVS